MVRTVDRTVELACPQCGAPVALPEYAEVTVCAFCGSTLGRDRLLAATRASAIAAASLPADVAAPAIAPEEGVLHSVRCSQCAGPLSAREGRRILVCAHCGTRIAVMPRGGFSRWYLPPRVDRLRAAAIGAAWLRDYPGVSRQARDATFVEARLVYAPIWEHKALVAGWEFGYKLRTRTEPVGDPLKRIFGEENERLELRTYREGIKEPRLQERRMFQAATSFERLGATRPRLSGRELMLPLLAGEVDPAATVLEAEGSPADVAEEGRMLAVMPTTGAAPSDSHLFAFRESITLLYYPLWLVRYGEGARLCRVVVNGRDGSVNAATAPAANGRRIALLVGQVVLMAIVVVVLLWLGLKQGSQRNSLLALAVIVFVAAAFSIWRFRKAGEVEYHEPFSD